MSTKVAGLAKKDGYTNVRVYLDGQPAWIKAGNPVYTTRETIDKGNIVLIDLRSAEKSAQGRIPRAVSIPYATLEDAIEEIPDKAPLVLYGDSQEEALKGLKELRSKGFKKIALVEGNYTGWIKAGGKSVKGPVVTEINWQRRRGKNEVSRAEFLKAAEGRDASAVILDVRTEKERAAGGFKNALAIPLDQIFTRRNEIPKDKKIYVHCTTGARAEMCVQELKKNGYKAFFLVADIECRGDDCEIED